MCNIDIIKMNSKVDEENKKNEGNGRNVCDMKKPYIDEEDKCDRRPCPTLI